MKKLFKEKLNQKKSALDNSGVVKKQSLEKLQWTNLEGVKKTQSRKVQKNAFKKCMQKSFNFSKTNKEQKKV